MIYFEQPSLIASLLNGEPLEGLSLSRSASRGSEVDPALQKEIPSPVDKNRKPVNKDITILEN